MNNKLERMQKEVVMDEFKLLSQHLPGGTEEHHENSQDSRSVAEI
jgi:hypothetical protein